MATARIPPTAQFSKAAERCNELMERMGGRLQHIAWRTINVRRKKNDQFFVVCVEVDSRWRSYVDLFMPGEDWDKLRAAGVEPFALGALGSDEIHFFLVEFPDLKEVLLETPQPDKVKAIVLTDGGCTVYEIEPKRAARS